MMLIVLTTVAGNDSAEVMARGIVAAKLAACVQILPRMTSLYVWNDEVQKEDEHLLLIKTMSEKYDELERFIRANHSYEVPEIAAVEASKVSEAYAAWMTSVLG